MQSWGEVLLMVDAYQDAVRRIENRHAHKGDPFIGDQRPSRPVIRLIKRLKVKTKAAAGL